MTRPARVSDQCNNVNRFLHSLVALCLLLSGALVILSAWLRLDQAGLGCAGWPACYGRIGIVQSSSTEHPDTKNVTAQIRGEHRNAHAWAIAAHRLIAGLLGIGVLALAIYAVAGRRQGMPVVIALSLLVLTVFLAVLGIWSGSPQRPAVMLGNLCGGFAVLALLWLWRLRGRPSVGGYVVPRTLRAWIDISLILLGMEILLGGLTSANFAALACRTFPDCHGAWLPTVALAKALNIMRALPAIHMAHRLGAWLTLLVLGWTGIQAIRTGGAFRKSGIVVLVLLTVEVVLGATTALTNPPIALAAAHNAVAALLLLGTLSLQHEVRTARR